MDTSDSDRLADVVAALGEFAGRLDLDADARAALQAELDAMRMQMLYRPGVRTIAESLRALRAILAGAGDNRLARAAAEEIDDLLAGAGG